jgi:hypothetical protein
MKICVVGDCEINNCKALPVCDVALFPFKALGVVDYERELSGGSEKFEELARLSKACKCGIICGCETVSRAFKRKSAAATDRGKLLGISDMLCVLDGEDYKSGAQLGVFAMGGYKVGVCIGNDLMFPENVKSMSLCGCNLIAVLLDGCESNMPVNIIRTYAYLYGVPIVMSAGKLAYFADITGAIASSNQKITLFEADPKNSYRLVTTRRKGLFQDYTTDF